MSQASGPGAPGDPASDLLLAQALENILRAERAAAGAEPGPATEAVQAAPEHLRDDLRRLVHLAHALQSTAATVRPSPRFREAARARLMQRITADAANPPPTRTPLPWRAVGRRVAPWLSRVAAGFVAVSIAGSATVTASASALPGEPLYGVKQMREALTLRLAADDEARAVALLRQADARLDETTRLLGQGRAAEALALAAQYDATVERATATLAAVAVEPSGPVRADGAAASAQEFERRLLQHQERLQSVQAEAPPAAREGVERAIRASSRGLERAAEVHRRRGRGPGPAPAAPARLEDAALVATPTAGATSSPTPAGGPEHTPATAPMRQTEERGRGNDRGQSGNVDDRRGPGARGGGGGQDRGRGEGPPENPEGPTGKPGVDQVATPVPPVAPRGPGPLPAAGDQAKPATTTPTPSATSGEGRGSGRDSGRDEQGPGRNGGGPEDGGRRGRR